MSDEHNVDVLARILIYQIFLPDLSHRFLCSSRRKTQRFVIVLLGYLPISEHLLQLLFLLVTGF